MRNKLVLLAVLVALMVTGYFVWNNSFTDAISDQDVSQISQIMDDMEYGTNDLNVVNLYDSHDHAKYLYAWNECGYVILFKSNYQFIEGGEGLRYRNYLSNEYKLYYFAPMGYYAGLAGMSFKEAQAQGLLHDIHQEELDELSL